MCLLVVMAFSPAAFRVGVYWISMLLTLPGQTPGNMMLACLFSTGGPFPVDVRGMFLGRFDRRRTSINSGRRPRVYGVGEGSTFEVVGDHVPKDAVLF